jgi:hypothetical protein
MADPPRDTRAKWADTSGPWATASTRLIRVAFLHGQKNVMDSKSRYEHSSLTRATIGLGMRCRASCKATTTYP